MFPILARSLSSSIVILPTYCKQGDKKCDHDLMMEQCSDGTLRLMNRGYPWFGTVACSFAFVLSGNSKVVVYRLNRSGLHLNRAGMDKLDIFFFFFKIKISIDVDWKWGVSHVTLYQFLWTLLHKNMLTIQSTINILPLVFTYIIIC